ncbi:sensor histidine kinase, partial [Pseudomonas sp. CrR25]|nr:sensor histidine kinase [Pseudomonas sp. CrR25]
MSIEANVASPSPAVPPKANPTASGSGPAPASSPRLSLWRKLSAPLRRLSRSSQFVIAASIILGLTMTFVGNLVSRTIERSAVQAAADAGALYMATFLEPYVQELTTAGSLSVETAQAIDHLMTSPSLNAHVISVKIWGPDGSVLYSTNKDLMHRSFSTKEIALALEGKIVTEWGELNEEENAYERSLGIPLYEIYAPLREFGTGRIIAVGEFYEQAEALQQEIDRIRREVWSIVGTATLAMLVLLFAIVHRGERIIVRQQQTLGEHIHKQTRLHAQNISLQRKITAANQAFSRINELTLRRIGADLHDG